MPAKLRSKRLACTVAAFLVAGAACADADRPAAPLALADAGFAVKLPKIENVVYRGMVSFDAAGGPGAQMLYPGGLGMAGFLVAIATHGVIVESSKNSERTRLQEEADKVLAPYKDTLAGFSNKELMQRGIERLSMSGPRKLIEPADAGDQWILESAPVFTMTQDQSALVLENAIAIYPANAPTSVRYQNVVKVVSHARDEAEPQALWIEGQGKLLKDESVALFAHSLQLVLQEVAKSPGTEAEVHKTFRYSEGKAQKIERAQLLARSCERAIIKTLRGWLMSIPLHRAADDTPAEQCKNAERYPA